MYFLSGVKITVLTPSLCPSNVSIFFILSAKDKGFTSGNFWLLFRVTEAPKLSGIVRYTLW